MSRMEYIQDKPACSFMRACQGELEPTETSKVRCWRQIAGK